jgi:carbon monoxide dehydrogenase subunit G
MSRIIHRDVMEFEASPEQVRGFITNPERIADYYPGLIDYGTFTPGKAIWCSGKSGVSLLEVLEQDSSGSRITLEVITSNSVRPPYSAAAIKASAFLRMVEDWELEECAVGTRLTKTWRDLVKYRMKWLPMGFIVRRTAAAEHDKIIEAWNRAARSA